MKSLARRMVVFRMFTWSTYPRTIRVMAMVTRVTELDPWWPGSRRKLSRKGGYSVTAREGEAEAWQKKLRWPYNEQ